MKLPTCRVQGDVHLVKAVNPSDQTFQNQTIQSLYKSVVEHLKGNESTGIAPFTSKDVTPLRVSGDVMNEVQTKVSRLLSKEISSDANITSEYKKIRELGKQFFSETAGNLKKAYNQNIRSSHNEKFSLETKIEKKENEKNNVLAQIDRLNKTNDCADEQALELQGYQSRLPDINLKLEKLQKRLSGVKLTLKNQARERSELIDLEKKYSDVSNDFAQWKNSVNNLIIFLKSFPDDKKKIYRDCG